MISKLALATLFPAFNPLEPLLRAYWWSNQSHGQMMGLQAPRSPHGFQVWLLILNGLTAEELQELVCSTPIHTNECGILALITLQATLRTRRISGFVSLHTLSTCFENFFSLHAQIRGMAYPSLSTPSRSVDKTDLWLKGSEHPEHDLCPTIYF